MSAFVRFSFPNQSTTSLQESGYIFSCGNNNFGQCGHLDATTVNFPSLIKSITSIISVSCGEHHSLALKGENKSSKQTQMEIDDGRIYSFGNGEVKTNINIWK